MVLKLQLFVLLEHIRLLVHYLGLYSNLFLLFLLFLISSSILVFIPLCRFLALYGLAFYSLAGSFSNLA